MAKYRKLPVVIEAEIYSLGMEDGADFYELSGKFICSMTRAEMEKGYPKSNRKPFINTLEGKHYISDGDYIITGIAGERYPCKPDIFEQTYELVNDD